jgi:hypothetical protein
VEGEGEKDPVDSVELEAVVTGQEGEAGGWGAGRMGVLMMMREEVTTLLRVVISDCWV